jgi:hypothetical protein
LALLTIQSEREAIEMSILQNLINITESSPEFAQVVDITAAILFYHVVFFVALVARPGPVFSRCTLTAAVAACFGAPGALYFYYPDVADH